MDERNVMTFINNVVCTNMLNLIVSSLYVIITALLGHPQLTTSIKLILNTSGVPPAVGKRYFVSSWTRGVLWIHFMSVSVSVSSRDIS